MDDDVRPLISPRALRTERLHPLRPHGRAVWVLHHPTIDRRTQRAISLHDVSHALGTDVRVLFPGSVPTADCYVSAARALYDAWQDEQDGINDGDVIVSVGGDLHTVTMIDDILRQCGITWYTWAKHVGHGRYVELVKLLDQTQFAPTPTEVSR